MASISEALELARLGNQTGAAEILRGEFEKLQSAAHRVDLCEWIANCFERLDDFLQAGNWYELAGELILTQVGLSMTAAVVNAYPEFKRAFDCYSRCEETEDVERSGQILAALRNSFAAA